MYFQNWYSQLISIINLHIDLQHSTKKLSSDYAFFGIWKLHHQLDLHYRSLKSLNWSSVLIFQMIPWILIFKPNLWGHKIEREECLASSLLNIICYQNWYQSKSDYMDRAWDSNLEDLKWRSVLVTSKISFDDQNLRYHRALIFIRSSKLISKFFQFSYWSLAFYQKVLQVMSSLESQNFILDLPNDTLDFDLQN